ncbi:tRNA lysidine(34) synthetase TilS [Temperatibacter marinus]|uniref:tRNA(Ile)-lysidine synthase n=1 Tax=Temperatibacter marinus TaxID=1456591 RepID=A0AA52EIF6_9PROT|nr:tRNA lysidine(34) synthetase TilS [Temperatibacter marinus]WND02894.1 tRNA lysidine(34) synthetase TilS [Temperatibacter marinus]
MSKSNCLAVGVSGGADSLALILSLKDLDYTVHALIVDHGLRAESTREAHSVAKIMQSHDIPYSVLKWTGEKPLSNIQSQAREARYALMKQWCLSEKIGNLLVAHHRDDQAETFLLRLARGSGIKGLQAMQKVTSLDPSLNLLRPFLNTPKSDLESYLLSKNVTWIKDPSNENISFDRVQIRNFLKTPPHEGFSAQRLVNTAQSMQKAQSALDYYVSEWLTTWVNATEYCYVTINSAGLHKAPEEIVERSLTEIIKSISGKDYAPRYQKLLTLKAQMREGDFKAATLDGVVFRCAGPDLILVYPEEKTLLKKTAKRTHHYGGSWELSFDPFCEEISVGPLGKEGWASVCEFVSQRLDHIPFEVRLILPTYRNAAGEILGVYTLGLDASAMDRVAIKCRYSGPFSLGASLGP